MSKWDEIVNANGEDEWLQMCNEALVEVQREHAHKLAELIRKDIGPVKDSSDNFIRGASYAADLVDPEVED